MQLGGFAGEPAGANIDGALLEPIVDEIAAYIRTRKLGRPAIVGHSMGGLIALMLAERHPDLVGRVMIVDALPFYPMLMGPTLTASIVEPRAAQLRDSIAAMPDEAFRTQQNASVAALLKSEAARPPLLDQSMRSDRKVAARAIYEVMTTDMRPKLAAIKTPLTIAYATNAFAPEELVGPLYRSYAAAPKARLQPVADSYHFMMIDQPERFNTILKDFLERKE
jgi:pimeloyl-ACP methyl ester carboxylesterase